MSDRTSSPVGPPPALPSVPGVDDLQIIGRGGFGVVYRGHQRDLGRDVAVKVLSAPGADERSVELWRREVTAMGRLSNHPNIVAAFSAGVTGDGSPYLVMPYVPGGSLHDRINAHGALVPADAVRIGSRVASGLGAAHAAGVLHRDVKPANVLMSEYGEPQLTDFGIARLVDAATTTTGSVRATIGYAAPEVLGGDPATPASDVYGLGATLHAALAGRAPFAGTEGESFAARIGRVMTQPPPDLRALGVPPALAAVVASALAKDPAERPQTADDLRHRLDSLSPADLAAGGVGTDGATEVLTPVPRPADDGRRRRMLLVAAAVVAVVLLVGLASWVLVRGGDDEPDVATGPSTTAPSTAAPSTAEAPSTTAPTTSEAPSEPPSSLEAPTTTETSTTTTEPAEAPTEKELREALTDYYATVDAGDLEAGYALLSPRYQAEQPYQGYQDFWRGIRSVDVRGRPRIDVDARTVDATLHFVDDEGATSDDGVRLTFVDAGDGRLLIDRYEQV